MMMMMMIVIIIIIIIIIVIIIIIIIIMAFIHKIIALQSELRNYIKLLKRKFFLYLQLHKAEN